MCIASSFIYLLKCFSSDVLSIMKSQQRNSYFVQFCQQYTRNLPKTKNNKTKNNELSWRSKEQWFGMFSDSIQGAVHLMDVYIIYNRATAILLYKPLVKRRRVGKNVSHTYTTPSRDAILQTSTRPSTQLLCPCDMIYTDETIGYNYVRIDTILFLASYTRRIESASRPHPCHRRATVPCHRAVPPCRATAPCPRATVPCLRAVPPCRATVPCHRAVPPCRATVPCHRAVPPCRATVPCHRAVSPRRAKVTCGRAIAPYTVAMPAININWRPLLSPVDFRSWRCS